MATGSQATRGAYPAVCSGCGGPVYVTSKKDTRPLWFESCAPEWALTSWHHACHPLLKEHP